MFFFKLRFISFSNAFTNLGTPCFCVSVHDCSRVLFDFSALLLCVSGSFKLRFCFFDPKSRLGHPHFCVSVHDCSWALFDFVYFLICVFGSSVSGLLCLRWQIGTTMVQEEQKQRCSTSSSGGCGGVNGSRGGKSSKKIKQTKIPQRGLGVEKLEKIRLEEQRKNETTTMPVLRLHNHNQQQNTSSISVSHLDLFSPPLPLPHANSSTHYNVINTGNSDSVFAWPGPVMVDGYNCVPSTCNAQELNHDLESKRLVSEFTIGLNSLNAQKDLKPNWPCSVPVPRKQQHQQVSTLMNVCASPISSSSGLNLQMEPPSNQSCYSNYYSPPFWPEEEKMVGMKRPWPFSLDNPPGPSYKFHQIIPTLFKPGESSSFEHKNIGTLECFDSLREAHNLSSPCSFKWSTKMLEMNQSEIVDENGPLDGNSLSLGFSTTVFPSRTSKSKQPLSFSPAHYPQLNGLTYQVGIEDPLINPGSSVQDRRLYSFFPLKTPQIGHGISNERRDEAENDVDLTLKL